LAEAFRNSNPVFNEKKNLEIGLAAVTILDAGGKGCMKWLPVVLVLIGRKAGLFSFLVKPWGHLALSSGE